MTDESLETSLEYALRKYKKYSSLHVEQLESLLENINKNTYKNLKTKALEIIKEGNGSNKVLKKVMSFLLRNHRYYPHDMPKGRKLYKLYASNNRGDKIYFNKIVYISDSKYLYEGKLVRKNGDEEIVVVKWLSKYQKNIQDELNNMKKMKEYEADMYEFEEFNFWDTKIICMEKLYPITPEDNEYNIGIQILKTLIILHKFGLHSDIKIDNIMKKGDKVYLIDYGGVTTSKLSYGYRRRTWSHMWTSQPRTRDQITTYKNDFLELGYTMRGLQLKRNKEYKTCNECVEDYKDKHKDCKKCDKYKRQLDRLKNRRKLCIHSVKKFDEDLLMKYINKVDEIEENNFDLNIYEELINILKEGI